VKSLRRNQWHTILSDTMTNEQLAGRMKVLEVFTMTALGLYLANSRNDPDYSKATALLEYIRAQTSAATNGLPLQSVKAAEQYVNDLTQTLAANLHLMRGEGGGSVQ
jgi:hypothetical protein